MDNNLAPTKWMLEIYKKWLAEIAHMFIIHGNVDDLVYPAMKLKHSLLAFPLLSKRKATVVYDRSKGISFPLESHKEAFLQAVGLNGPVNGAMAAIQQARNSSSAGEENFPKDPSAALALIEKILTKIETVDGQNKPLCGVIIEQSESICPDADLSAMGPEDRTILVTLARWAREEEFIRSGPPIFLITENLNDLHTNLRRASSRIETIKIPYPDHEERLTFIKSLEGYSHLVEDTERFAAQTAGLKRIHIEDILQRALMDNIQVNDELVRERKEEIVRSEFGDILEIIEPTIGFEDVGGMGYIKEFFMRSVVRPMKESRYTRVPMGVLMMGPAGTGKTVVAEAVAKESGMNCCSLNVGKLLGSLMGSSERNLERALECITALAPTIVVVDEIDQSGLSRNTGGDSGVSNRIFRRLLEFMADTKHRGKILFLGITNRPDLLDAALKRPGRFDIKLPILAPEADEREAIIRVLMKKYKMPHRVNDLTETVEKTGGWTGAELEALVRKAYEIAEDGKEILSEKFLKDALERYQPTTQDIRQMTNLALNECNDLDLLPPKYRAMKLAQIATQKEVEKLPSETGRYKRSSRTA